MREPRPIPGARAALFDRLVDPAAGPASPAVPARVQDFEQLRESVRMELSRLLNSRSAIHVVAGKLAEGTVLDYGLPDFTHRTPANETDQRELSEILARRISIFEPRLQDVRVVLSPSDADPRVLEGVLSASLRIGQVTEPVTFPLMLECAGRTGEQISLG